jgi:hypothetical protein
MLFIKARQYESLIQLNTEKTKRYKKWEAIDLGAEGRSY